MGFAAAADEIGTMYLVGTEIMANMDEAFAWYKRGADRDEPICQYHLGVCYHEGLGTEADEDKALEYLYQAYTAGFPGAMEYMTENMNMKIN